MTKPMINCYVCGSWIKPSRTKTYKCTKCKAQYQIVDGKVTRIYKNSEGQYEDNTIK